jgi:cell division protein FtsQ
MRKYNWKKILINTFWVLAGIGAIVLLGAAMQKKNQKQCTDIKIEITGIERHMFIDEKDVLDMLNASVQVIGTKIVSLNLRNMESLVEKNPWVSNAEMFLDNNQVLQVRIEERQPVARVFTLAGSSFYIDSTAMRLPLSDKLSARVPTFTGFPSDRESLSKPDSVLLHNVVQIGRFVLTDSFWMAQVAQIEITPQSNFEMVPVMGDHIVTLGNAEDIDKKFNRLYTFYRKAWLQNGMNTYEKLDVQYANQVVAIKKGATKAWVDSARVHQLLQGMAQQTGLPDSNGVITPAKMNPTKTVNDSTTNLKVATPVIKPPVKEIAKTNSAVVSNNKGGTKTLTNGKKPKAKKPVKKKPVAITHQPKAVMDKKG